MRIFGVYAHGVLALALLFTAGLFYGHPFVACMAIMSAGFAYAAEFLAHWMNVRGEYHLFNSQLLLCAASVASGVAGYAALVLKVLV